MCPSVTVPAVSHDHAPLEGNVRRSISANFLWMLTGNAVYAVCQWGLLGLFARLGSPDMVGQIVLALAVTSPVMAFFLMQLRAVQATETGHEFQFGHYFALRAGCLLLALILITAIAFVGDISAETRAILLAIALMSVADGLSDTAYGLLQRHERLKPIAQSMMLRGSLGLLATWIGFVIFGRVFEALLGGACVRWMIAGIGDLRTVRQVSFEMRKDWLPRWEFRKLWSLVCLASPLGFVMMLIVLNTTIPRYFVEQSLGSAALGIFGAISYIAVAGTMIVGALGESITPRLARLFVEHDKRRFLRLLFKLNGCGALIGIAGVLVAYLGGPWVLSILYGPDYARHADLFVWIMLAAAVGYVASFSGYAMTAARLFRAQIPLFAVVAGTNAVACGWLVPAFGLTGAAMSLLISAVVQWIGTLFVLRVGLMDSHVRNLTVNEAIVMRADEVPQ